jgi:ABC-type transport system involved in cytochrome c biogenesis permease subunit
MLDLIEMIRRWAVAWFGRAFAGKPVRTWQPQVLRAAAYRRDQRARIWHDREYK